MKVIAEERRQKTDQLLYSLPLTMTKVVMGKYLALLCMFLLPLAIISIYPLVLSMFGNVNLTAAFGSIFGFFCLGSALIAIGVFVSSITESQAVAAGVCFVIMLLNYFLSSLSGFVSTSASASLYALIALALVFALIIRIMTKSNTISGVVAVLIVAGLVIYYKVDATKFEGLFSDFIGKLSLFERFDTFVDGIFDITAVVYYISIAGLFLFLSVQTMEKRRWSE